MFDASTKTYEKKIALKTIRPKPGAKMRPWQVLLVKYISLTLKPNNNGPDVRRYLYTITCPSAT